MTKYYKLNSHYQILKYLIDNKIGKLSNLEKQLIEISKEAREKGPFEYTINNFNDLNLIKVDYWNKTWKITNKTKSTYRIFSPPTIKQKLLNLILAKPLGLKIEL